MINNIRLLSTFLTGLTNLAKDPRLRKLLSERTLFWNSLIDVLVCIRFYMLFVFFFF